MRIRGGSGLGDSVYLRPVADYLISTGERVQVRSHYPDLFAGSGAEVIEFKKYDVDVIAHYASSRKRQTTNQFQDVCESAGIPEIPLSFEWEVLNTALVDDVRSKAGGRKVILVHGGREPFGRGDGLGMSLMPSKLSMEAALSSLSDCYTVRLGKGKHFYSLNTDLDLVDKTSVSDLIDLHKVCDGVVTQCGFPIPLAECFDKPVLVMFGAAARHSNNLVIQLITPAKILCKPSSTYAADDWTVEKIKEAVSGFRQF